MAEHGGGGRGDPGDKAREEFFSEAQELIDGLGRDLLALDAVSKGGRTDPELINDIFRAVHTLKGLAGLFGATLMSGLSHELEDVLDDLRLGRLDLTAAVLDVLFRAVELYARILAAERSDTPEEPAQEVKALLHLLGQVSQRRGGGGASPVAQYELDPGLLGVLTEYEEYRLRTNISQGVSLFRIRVQFRLDTIDSALDELKARARPHGEIITYLPTGAGGDSDSIELEILLASHAPLPVLEAALGGSYALIEEVQRRGPRSKPPPTVAPYAPEPPQPVPPGSQAPDESPEPRSTFHPGPIERPEPPAPGFPATEEDVFGAEFHTIAPTGQMPVVEPRPSAMPPMQREIPLPVVWGRETSTTSSTPSDFPPPHPPIGDVRFTHRSRATDVDDILRSIPPPPPAEKPQSYPPAAAGREMSLRSVSQTVRVDIRKLDHLMNIVGELAITRTSLAKLSDKVRLRPEMRSLANELYRLHRAFERNLAQMQNGILEVRMVPLGQAFDKLARIVRQISREHDKQVNLVVTGAETEIDKLIVEELSDPLMHMIRNAIDHGIEQREERERVGKPTVGTIALNAFQKGNHVVIEVEDDGAGMNTQVLLASAVRRGLLTREQAAELLPHEILGLVFLPGFTTRGEATDLSGRGVGMDIVKTNISRMGGIIDISSEVGIGTKMTITLPITLAVISVLVIEIAGRTYAIPLASVEEAIVFDEREVRAVEEREVMNQRGRTLPICRLWKLFGHAPLEPLEPTKNEKRFVVIAAVGNRKLGFVVDRLVGQQDIVIKALGKSLARVRGFAGATELGDQRVALVLDVAALVEEVLSGDGERLLEGRGERNEGRALETRTEGKLGDGRARA
ncbi:chemotaxis protein CheW [Pendulispora albinea]|uniref:histidine kinase n=1 Tax=Pendulispora albinea TaxID=2741071 RepID=A0ABZ2M599_9BACT